MRDIKVKSGPRPSGVPVIVEFPAAVTATEGDDGVSPAHRPEHAGLLEPADNRFARGFDHPGPHEESLLTKFRIAHPLFVLFEIVRFDLQDLR